MRPTSHSNEQQQETEIVGDIEAFMAYVESGAAAQDWEAFLALRPDCFARAEAEIRRLYGGASSHEAPSSETRSSHHST